MEFDAIYIAANQFKILNDQRQWFVATERVQVDCDGTLYWSSIDTVSFDSTYTIVTITKSVLTDPCTTARVGGVYSGATGNLPPHTHEDDDTGGSGVVGEPPTHEYRNYNTEIRFKLPDGSWGEWQLFGYTYKEAWTTGHTYSPNDLVTKDGCSYGCIVYHTADATTEPGVGVYWATYWFVLASAGPEGSTVPVNSRGQWVGNGYWDTPEHFTPDATDYALSDLVYNHGLSYYCILAHNSDTAILDAEPGVGSIWETYWNIFADNGYVNWITDAYSGGVDYYINDALNYQGTTYICIADHTSGATTTPGSGVYWDSYWAVIAEAGEPGIIWIEGGWVISTLYSAGDALAHNGSSYVCILFNSSDATTEPGIGAYWATYWELLAEKGDDGTSGTPGLPGLVWIGAWLTATEYDVDDAVYNAGSSYICILNHESDATTEPGIGAYWATYWDVLAAEGQQGVAGIIGDWIGPWETSFGYILDDCVSNDGSSYVCIDAHTSDASTEPGVGVYWATYWELIAQKGDIGIDWIGAWSGSSVSYDPYDAVSNDGSSYICILSHTSDASTEPGTGTYWATYWELLAGDSGEGGGGGVVESTWATRPAAGTAGRLHLPTDSIGFPAYDTGSVWTVHHPLNFACTNPPAYGSFTKVNGSTETTLVADGDGLLMTQWGTASATRLNVGYVVALPSAPYTLTVGMDIIRMYMVSNVHIGLCLTDGTNPASAKCVSIALVTPSTTAINDMYQTWNPFNTYSGVINNTQHLYAPFYHKTLFIRIVDDNSNRSYELSLDGVIWEIVYSESRTTFLTATHAGLWIAHAASIATTKISAQAKIFHWTLA